MREKRKLVYLGNIVGFLAAMWLISSTPTATAHEGHKHKNAPASAKKLKNPLTTTEENIAQGRRLFNQHCTSCHSEDGKAKTAVAAGMKRKPTDLTGKAMRGISDGEVYWVVTNGIKKAGMPAYQVKASDQERWQMTLYVKHLMGEHPQAGHSEHPAAPQQQGQHEHHAAVDERGDKVMGFSHAKTVHLFRLKSDGGIIKVEANDPADATSRDQIRDHLNHIAQKFAAGDFSAPMLIHAKTPPGVPVMKQLKAAIKYGLETTERGARIRITTSDKKALAAVHDFLRFQIADHKTGDSVEVEKSP